MESYGFEVTVPANGTTNQTEDISLEGHTALGVVGWAPNVYGVVPERFNVVPDGDKNILIFRARSMRSGSTTLTIWFNILYVKN